MYNPVSTYRIQFHQDFTLQSLEAIMPYLQVLGVRTIYASPIFEAVPGSAHGYDGVNPLRINPEIGTEDELRRISRKLHASGIGWVQDIVPNHMAFHPSNGWLMDVLREGRESAYASWFDIDWDTEGKLMVPVLGDTLDKIIGRGELVLTHDNGHFLHYGGNRFPLKPGEYPEEADAGTLTEIVQAQHYRLCHWQETDRRINYRRFFTVNGLICLNVQDERVFNEIHSLTATLVRDGIFDGLRIDHIDGLYDPTAYLERLRVLCGPHCYIVAEKILQPGESVPKRWPIAGTTGYDFLGLVNNLFTRSASKQAFTTGYHKLTSDSAPPGEQADVKKRYILEHHMQGELNNLTRLAAQLLPQLDITRTNGALAAFLVHCSVYRYYANRMPIPPDEAQELSRLFALARQKEPAYKAELTALERLLLEAAQGPETARQEAISHFYRRLMQYTGPLMAKGVEDTLMYTYGRAIGHNDVGDSPESFGISVGVFHKAMLERQSHWPMTQNATSTHDTKRGEDARALLNVLTHAPDLWFKAVGQWRDMNREADVATGPDPRDEYFLYQTLFATYPVEETDLEAYPQRLTEYLRKALREGKRRSDWAVPDEAYEQSVIDFATRIVAPDSAFLRHFQSFRQSLTAAGILLSLSQLVLKLTCPGLPDVYQGTELWDLSFVDPDNRRPVDYVRRMRTLTAVRHGDDAEPMSWASLWNERETGSVKLWLLSRLLHYRAGQAGLFAAGEYVPLKVSGTHAEHLIAFARRHQRSWVVIAVPIGIRSDGQPFAGADWGNTEVLLPGGAPSAWHSIFTGDAVDSFSAGSLFRSMPLAVLEGEIPENRRSAGVLMAISSLPGRFGIGDIGPEARRFARSLSRAGQRTWQLLPLNPVGHASGFSPYSSVSTMAGNTLLLSPEMLVDAGLIDNADLQEYLLPQSAQVDYERALQAKTAILDLAYDNYCTGDFASLRTQVNAFREANREWLDHYALYLVIKAERSGAPWYDWPEALRAPGSSDAQRYRQTHAAPIGRIVWEQALFDMQWRQLRRYCNGLNIQFIGDLPFYLSYDSADVWANQQLFSLEEDGRMKGIAGVPPDYFSETGQLWGMPTFDWRRHKAQDYSWWIGRLRRNLELYDQLRIDHFRALAEYWEVPAGEETAVNGTWLPGPGAAFFDAMREALGAVPFIAEDLGDNMDNVYALRETVDLPGMKVMQFAFGENMPTAVDAPHNYPQKSVCYTGTHDNNTTLGWFRQELDESGRSRIGSYTGKRPTPQNINGIMTRLVFGSVSEQAILPMQDVLGLDERHRMNTPGKAAGNWHWRMSPDAFSREREGWLHNLSRIYNRL